MMRAACYLFFVASICLLFSCSAQQSGKFDYGFALEFDGAKDFVSLPSASLIGGPLTIQAWVYPLDTSTGTVVQFGRGINADVVRFTWYQGNMYFVIGNKDGQTNYLTAALPLNKWSMVTGIIRANKVAELYVGGTLISSDTRGVFYVPRSLTRAVNNIGRDNSGNYFKGYIDEVLVYANDIQSSEVVTRKVITGNETNVLYYWNFDDGIGVTATDLGATHSDGALGGGDYYRMPFWVVPLKVASQTCTSSGDPHITTFDGIYFHPMNVGEFWVSRTFDNSVSVMNRQDRWIGNANAAVNIGLALRAYGDTVSIDVNFRAHPGIVYVHVNGQDYSGQNAIYLPNSGILLNRVDGDGWFYWEIDVPFMYTIRMWSYTSSGSYYSNYWFRLYQDKAGPNMGGECGNWDGNPNNDFTNPITHVLYPFNTWQSWQDYVATLAVPWSQSYFNDQNVFVDFVPTTTIVFQDPQLEVTAHSICDNTKIVSAKHQWSCLYDIAVTGDIGLAVPWAQSTYQECLTSIAGKTVDANTVCTKPCPGFCSMSGTCTNGVCKCNAGRTGKDCSIQKQYWCYKATWDLGSLQPETVTLNPIKNRQTASDWYAYNTQHPASAFTGYEIVNSTLMLLHNQFFGVDKTNTDVSFVLINDKYDDGSGGTMSIKTTLTDMNGTPLSGTTALVLDDPGDDLTWDADLGTGVFNWIWWPCCTDGVALGPIKSTTPWKLHLDIDFDQVSGIEQFFVGSRALTGGLDLFKIESAKAKNGIDITGGMCFDPCGDQDNCTSCLDQVECGWCNDDGVCQAGTATGPAKGTRCKNWRYSKDPSVSRIVNFETGYPMDPSYYQVFLAANDPVDAHVYVNLPLYKNLPVDVLVIQDLAYNNFNPYLNFLTSIYRGVFLATTAIYPLARFGLASFMDKPILPYGNPVKGDYVYRTNVYMTNNPQRMQGGIDKLVIGDGQDAPGSQLEALLQVSQRIKEVGFTDGKRVALVVTKGVFHTPVGGSFVPNNLDGVVDANEDYPNPSDVRNALLLANIVPVFVVTPDIVDTYRDLVNTWGFGYVSLMSSSIENMGAQMLEGINFVVNSAYLTPVNRGFIDSWKPQIYRGMSPGVRVNFDVRLSASTQNTASVSAPGFGILNMESTNDDLPKPTADDTYTLYEDTFVVATLSGTSPYPGSLTAVITSLPANGTLYQFIGGDKGDPITATGVVILNPLQQVYYAPRPFGHSIPAGSIYDTIEYKLLDSCDACSIRKKVNFIVIHVNHPPVANGQTTYTTDENVPVLLTLSGTDIDAGDVLSSFVTLPVPGFGKLYQYDATATGTIGALLVGGSNNASQINDPSGRVWFVPDPYRFGNPYSSFPYGVSDGTATSNPLVVKVIVNEVNFPPTANSYKASTLEDTIVALLLTGTDPDGDTLSATITALPNRGTLYQDNNGVSGVQILSVPTAVSDANGKVWYLANANIHSLPDDSISFNVSDPGVPPPQYSAAGTVTINVTRINDAPDALPSNATGLEDQEVTITLNGFDVDTTTNDGDVLNAIICTYPVVGTLYQYPGHQLIDPSKYDNTINGWAVTDPGMRVIYAAPQYGNCGTCTDPYTWFLFKVADRALGFPDRLVSDCANATLSLIHVNHPPTASTNNPVQGMENNDTVIPLQASDVDKDTLVNFRITSIPTQGTLFQATTDLSGALIAGAQIAAGDNVTATQLSPTSWVGNVVYRPVQFGNGKNFDRISFVANDNQVDSASFTATINVKFVNQVPVATSIPTQIILEDTDLIFEVNGTDVELSPLTSLLIALSPNVPAWGSLYQVKADGTIDSSSPVVFSTDGSPVAVTNQNFLVGFRPVKDANDKLVPWANNNGGVAAPFGSVTFAVTDGNATSPQKSFDIHVTPVNDPPYTTSSPQYMVIEDTPGAIPLTGSDPDMPYDSVTSVVTVIPTIGKLYQSTVFGDAGTQITSVPTDVLDTFGRVVYVPPPDACSNPANTPYDSLTYQMRDLAGATSPTQAISIIVYCVNDPPVASRITVNTAENQGVTVTLVGTDVDNTPSQLTFSVTGTTRGTLYQYDATAGGNTGARIPAGTVTAVTAGNMVVYVPAANDYSAAGKIYEEFAYSVSDGLLSDNSGRVAVYVALVPSPPVANGAPVTLNQDTSADVLCTGVSIDFPNAVLVAILVQGPSHGTIKGTNNVDVAVGATFDTYLRYTPNSHYRGSDSVIYKIYDGVKESAPYTIPITVLAVNHAPVSFMDGPVSGPQDTDVGPFVLQGSDEDGDTISAYVTALPTRGILYQVNADGSKGAQISVAGKITDSQNRVIYHQNADNAGQYGTNFDQFVYLVDDNTGTANSQSGTTTVVVNLTPVNLPPIAYYTTVPTGNEDTLISIIVFGNTGDSNTGITQTLTGTVTALPNKGVLYQEDGTTVVTQGSAITDFSTNDNVVYAFRLTFKPAANEHSVDDNTAYTTFTFQVTDSFAATSNFQTVPIIVKSVNDPPVPVYTANYTTYEDTLKNFTVDAVDIENDPVNVLVTYVGDAAQCSFYSGSTLLSVGSTIPAPASLAFLPAQDSIAVCSFRFAVVDSPGPYVQYTIYFYVTAVDDPPVVNFMGYDGVSTSEPYQANGRIVTLYFNVTDVDCDQNDIVASITTDQPQNQVSITALGRPSLPITHTIGFINNAISQVRISFQGTPGANNVINVAVTVTVDDRGYVGVLNPDLPANKQTKGDKTVRLALNIPPGGSTDNTVPATSGAVVGLGAAVAGVFGAYKFLKKKSLIDDADPWESDAQFDTTMDNPLYNNQGQNFNALYDGTTAAAATVPN